MNDFQHTCRSGCQTRTDLKTKTICSNQGLAVWKLFRTEITHWWPSGNLSFRVGIKKCVALTIPWGLNTLKKKSFCHFQFGVQIKKKKIWIKHIDLYSYWKLVVSFSNSVIPPHSGSVLIDTSCIILRSEPTPRWVKSFIGSELTTRSWALVWPRLLKCHRWAFPWSSWCWLDRWRQ